MLATMHGCKFQYKKKDPLNYSKIVLNWKGLFHYTEELTLLEVFINQSRLNMWSLLKAKEELSFIYIFFFYSVFDNTLAV